MTISNFPTTLRYFFACELLYSILSAWEYTRQDVLSFVDKTDINQRHKRWVDAYGNLAEIVVDEGISIKHEYIEIAMSDALFDSALGIGDTLVYHWGDELGAAGRKMYLTYPKYDEAVWVYFFYCRWLMHTLMMFDQVLHEQALQSTPFFTRYMDYSGVVEQFVSLLEKEHPLLGMNDAEASSVISELKPLFDPQGERLAMQWRDTVISSTNRAVQMIQDSSSESPS